MDARPPGDAGYPDGLVGTTFVDDYFEREHARLENPDPCAKADLAEAPVAAIGRFESQNPGLPLHVVSSVTGQGLADVRRYFEGDATVALLGASGAGKSTLVNALAGEALQETGPTRTDGRGRHTTTRRALLVLPSGGVVLDTPGMRELRLWDAEEGVDGAFAEVASLAAACRFADCAHETEPGCAVLRALEEGALDPLRFASFCKLSTAPRKKVSRTGRFYAAATAASVLARILSKDCVVQAKG